MKLELGSSGTSLDASLETYLLWQFNSQKLSDGEPGCSQIHTMFAPPGDWAQRDTEVGLFLRDTAPLRATEPPECSQCFAGSSLQFMAIEGCYSTYLTLLHAGPDFQHNLVVPQPSWAPPHFLSAICPMKFCMFNPVFGLLLRGPKLMYLCPYMIQQNLLFI